MNIYASYVKMLPHHTFIIKIKWYTKCNEILPSKFFEFHKSFNDAFCQNF